MQRFDRVSLLRMRKAFTLIELLIVVAIIAILAAIAVPNFLEAQTRSKVSRTLADMRTIRTGLESYFVDNNHYPETDLGLTRFTNNKLFTYFRLTTPISYLTSIPSSPFKEKYGSGSADPKVATTINGYLYVRAEGSPGITTDGDGDTIDDNYEADRNYYITMGQLMAPAAREAIKGSGYWLLKSVGPDKEDDRDSGNGRAGWSANDARVYDPTNGTISYGDVVVFGDRPGTGKN